MKNINFMNFSLNGNSHCPESFLLKLLESKVIKERKDLKFSKTIYHDNGFDYGAPREVIVTRYGFFWITSGSISSKFFNNYDECIKDFSEKVQ